MDKLIIERSGEVMNPTMEDILAELPPYETLRQAVQNRAYSFVEGTQLETHDGQGISDFQALVDAMEEEDMVDGDYLNFLVGIIRDAQQPHHCANAIRYYGEMSKDLLARTMGVKL